MESHVILKFFLLRETSSPAINNIFKPISNNNSFDVRNQNLNVIAPVNLNSASVTQSLEQNKNNRILINRIPKPTMNSFLQKDEVTKWEVNWCILTVMVHKSLRHSEKDVQLIKFFTHDSDILKKVQLKKDKIAYTIAYGIAPFFNKQVLKEAEESDYNSVGFDESLNKVIKQTQMDLNIKYWKDVNGDPNKGEVVTKYLTSLFLGRTRATELLTAFKEETKDLGTKKLLQISMDGPNVNWAFLKDTKKEHQNSELIEIGSCGFHSVHKAFKDAMKATGWNLVTYLRALYNLFKDVPARRAKHLEITGSELFPLKFCNVRWLENVQVAERAIDIHTYLLVYKKNIKSNPSEPKCNSYKTVLKFLEDPLLCSKLAFFKSLAIEVETFLREFQSDNPLVPFLHTELCSVLSNIMERFMTASSLEKLSSVKAKDVENKNFYLPLNKIVLGFNTKKHLKNSSAKAELITKFKEDTKLAMQKFVTKLLIRSPLIYTLVKNSTSLDPYIN